MRRWISASVAAFGLLFLPALFVSHVRAQVNGVPASVTSPGFGGHAGTTAPRASVSSLGPRGYSGGPGGGRFVTGIRQRDGLRRDDRGRRRERNFYPGYGGVYTAYPYSYPYPYDEETADPQDDSDYRGGPTIFDRRGRGERSYVPPSSDRTNAHSYARGEARSEAQSETSLDPPAPEVPQTPTTLVFKDGRRIDVLNYAIVGATLFDLTQGHSRKVALADLDLDSTQKENEDHGVSFQLPPNPQAN